MNAVLVNRGGKEFGPYPIQLVQQYISNGTLFPHDLARDASDPSATPVALDNLLRKHGIAVQVGGTANPIQQAYKDLKSFDLRLILPWKEIQGFRWIQDRRLLALAGVGLSPIFMLSIAPGLSSGYWLIALYFSALWALFFFYIFRTGQTEARVCVLLFFCTGVVSIPILLTLQSIPPWRSLYLLASSQHLLGRFCGMFFGVGIHEELCKAALLFWIVRRPGRILIPQTVVFYGMMSGLGFGIYEGVVYQTTVNRAQEIDTAYFLNVARLTSLPFLHAIWTGIAGYFISFSALYPVRRYGLWVVAIVVPALLHALYNTFGWNLLGMGAALMGVVLLMTYLANCVRMQKSLSNP
jgi:RsiW-degrading membrane proteinase PrsW (M82 family)